MNINIIYIVLYIIFHQTFNAFSLLMTVCRQNDYFRCVILSNMCIMFSSLLFITLVVSTIQYEVPQASLLVFYPKGFSVSIPGKLFRITNIHKTLLRIRQNMASRKRIWYNIIYLLICYMIKLVIISQSDCSTRSKKWMIKPKIIEDSYIAVFMMSEHVFIEFIDY